MRTCRECGVESDLFIKHRAVCTPCRSAYQSAWYELNKDRVRQYTQQRVIDDPNFHRRGNLGRYGISVEQYAKLLASQNGLCAICGQSSEVNLHVDHDHKCCPTSKRSCGKCVRGLLCDTCNRGLGFFKDNPDTLMAAATYLRKDND